MTNQSFALNPALSFLSVGSRYHRRGGGITMRISMDRPTTKDVARFFGKVQITKHCWLWLPPLNPKGYGRFDYNNKRVLVHRFSYELFVGLIELGKQILHKRECGNRHCVNPLHLYMGTHTDNMRDMRIWGNVNAGERNGNSKLCESDVLAIRRAYKKGSYCFREIADNFNISKSHAYNIVRGIRWKHI